MEYHIISYKDQKADIKDDVYIAEGCILAGDVTIGSKSSIWFNSVIRGDVDFVKIGSGSNIQDGSVVHTSRFDGPTIIGNNVTVGHMCLLHACSIKDHAFIGMKALVMDHSVVEEYGFVAAGAVVTPRTIVKSQELWAGVPAKFIRKITDDEIKYMIETAQNYINLAVEYKRRSILKQLGL